MAIALFGPSFELTWPYSIPMLYFFEIVIFMKQLITPKYDFKHIHKLRSFAKF